MHSRHTICFILYLLGYVYTHTSIDTMQNIPGSSFPWVGILRLRHPRLRLDRVSGIILIARAVAIGNAYELSKIDLMTIANKAKAEFLIMGNDFSCDVKDYILHPEYYQQKVNTIAIVNMVDDERDVPHWQPIIWTRHEFSSNKIFYAVGYIDQPNTFEQEIHLMIPVTNQTCKAFYVREEMDFDSLWPLHTICLEETTEHSPCLYDAGMPLVSFHNGFWYLLGMSVHGPGCSVPARFIDLHSYINWIESSVGLLDAEHRPPTISDLVIPPEPHLDKDRVVINYGEPGNMELYFLRKGQKIFDEIIDNREWQNGTFRYKCPYSAVKEYTERGYIYSWPKASAYALITISYITIFLSNIKCMKIKVRGKKKSSITFNTTQGFIQEDLQLFQRLGPTKQSKMISLDERWSKLEYLKFLHIWLKVRVHWKAWYEIEFRTGLETNFLKLPTSVEISTDPSDLDNQDQETSTLNPFQNIYPMTTTTLITEETKTANNCCENQDKPCSSCTSSWQASSHRSIAIKGIGFGTLKSNFICALIISILNIT